MLTIRLLGDLEVLRDGTRLELPPSKKTRALLAYLVASGRSHRRERLCELLWEVPDDPRGALRWSLSKLRALVDEPGCNRIVAERESVAFSRQGTAVDLLELRELTAQPLDVVSTERLLDAAATAGRGDFLDGFDLSNQPEFWAWCAAEREEARAAHGAVLAALVQRLAGRVAPTEVLPHARALVALDPLAEPPRAALLRLLTASARREEAETQYRSGLQLLEEAGLPAPELRRTWRELHPPRVARVPPQPDAEDASVEAGLPEARPVPIAAEERKQVTVLVAAFSELGQTDETADPELMMRRLDPLLQAMRQAGARFEGSVTGVGPEGVTAVFGVPVAHEDDAVRACYAALGMREQVRALSSGEVDLGVGLHSGEVLVRPAQAGVEAVGPVVLATICIATEAGAGEILLSAETARRAEGFIEVGMPRTARLAGREAIELLPLHGRAGPRSRWEARAARHLTPLIGRDAEIEQLRRALRRATTGRGEVVTIVGEPGMGKSRLAHEFLRAELPANWTVLETGAGAHDSGAPYLPISTLLRAWLDVGERDAPPDIERKARLKLEHQYPELRDHRPVLFSLLDLPVEDEGWRATGPGGRRRQMIEAVRAALLRESRRQPLAVLFEDLHWADEQSLAMLDALIEGIGAAPVLLLVTHRPGHHRPDWARKSFFSPVRLDPLPTETAEEFLRSLLGDDPGVREIRRTLADRAEGTPLFLEEVVRALVDNGALVGQPGTYRLARPAGLATLPSTVQAVIAARIDRLPLLAKTLLQIGAVVGRDVPLLLLRHIAPFAEDALNDTLAQLQSAEFLFETRLPPEQEFTFKHALTHEVAYSGVLHERRRALHMELVDAIETLYRDRLDEQVERLAHHALAGGVWERAAQFLLRAADKAIRRSAHLQAAEFLRRGLEAVARLPESEHKLRLELACQKAIGIAMMAAKGWAAPEVAQAYARALVLCERLGDERELFTVLRGQGQFHMIRGELRTAREIGGRCTAIAGRSGDAGFEIETHHLFWSNSFFMGDYANAEHHSDRGITLYDQHCHHGLTYLYSGHDPGVCCRCFSGLVLWQRGLADQALQRCRSALLLAEELGHPLTLAVAQWGMSYVHLFRREPEQAQIWAEREIAVCERYGLPLVLSQGAFQLGWAMAAQGRFGPGIAKMREGLASTSATGAEMGLPYFIALLGEALAAAGDLAGGLAELDRALEIAAGNGARFRISELLRLKAELLLREPSNDPGMAERLLREAITAAHEQGARLPKLRASTSLARLLPLDGRAAGSDRRKLSVLYARFTEGQATADLADARRLLALEGAAPWAADRTIRTT